MKVLIQVPDSELTPSVQDLIKKPNPDGEEKRAIVYACLKLAIDDFYKSKITTDQYRLVME